jgi:hypothetical protein
MKNTTFLKTFFIISLIFMLAFSFTNVLAITGLNEQPKPTESPKQTTQSSYQGEVEQVANGQIDWEKGFIRVTGLGASPEGANKAVAPLLAQRAAMADAYRNAVAVLNGVRVDNRTYVKNMVTESDEISNTVQGLIKGGQFEKPSYDTVDGLYRCEIVLIIPVGGQKGLTSVLADFEKKEQQLPATTTPSSTPTVPSQTASVTEPNPTPAPTVAGSGNQNQPVNSTNSAPITGGQYTGIIIDARNLAVKPALYPQIFSNDGTLLYNQSMVNLDKAQFSTIVGYSRAMEKAAAMPRVGSNPLKLTAISVVKAAGGENTDIVLNSDTSNTFRQATSNGDLLSKAAVVIVIN